MSVRRSRSQRNKNSIGGTPKSRKVRAIRNAKVGKIGTITSDELTQSDLPYISEDGKLSGDAPIEALHMVGDLTARELREDDIKTVRDLKQANNPKFINYTLKTKKSVTNPPQTSFLTMKQGRIHKAPIKFTGNTNLVAKAKAKNGTVIEEQIRGKTKLYFVYDGQKVELGVKSGYLMEKIRSYLKGDITQENLLRKRVGREKLEHLGLLDRIK